MKNDDPDQSFFSQFKDVNFSDKFHTSVLVDAEFFKPEVIIDYVLVNDTNHSVFFSATTKPQAFIWRENIRKWEPLENSRLENMSQNLDVLCPSLQETKEVPYPCSFSLFIDIRENSYPATIRVVTIGDIMQNDEPTGEKIGVFFDVEIP